MQPNIDEASAPTEPLLTESLLIEHIRRFYGVVPLSIFLADGRRVPLLWRAHSPDFRSVRWAGEAYSFTPGQAAVIRVLWSLYEQGTPDVGDRTLLAEAGIDADRLTDVFKLGNDRHPAYGKMIVAGLSKGTHRLAD